MENCCGVGSFRNLMGIAEAVVFDDLSISFLVISGEGEVAIPAGVDILSENIKSSKFMASEVSTVA